MTKMEQCSFLLLARTLCKTEKKKKVAFTRFFLVLCLEEAIFPLSLYCNDTQVKDHLSVPQLNCLKFRGT